MSKILLNNGWISSYIKAPSPYHHPRTQNVSLIVIHSIGLPLDAPSLKDALSLLTGCLQPNGTSLYENLSKIKVSAHFLIDRQGDVYQLVSVNDVAWHCGQSFFKGKQNCNDFSIGIELVGHVWQGFTFEQYQKIIDLTVFLIKEYRLNIDSVLGHQHISPGRKTDPGYFDWSYFKYEVAKKLILS